MLTRVSCDCDGYEKIACSRQKAAGSKKKEVGSRNPEDRGQIFLWERLSPP